MMRCTLLAIPFLLATPLAAQQPAPTMMTMTTPPEIVTSAQGEAQTTPDRATISIGVETRAATAAAASTENARKQHAVIDTLRAMGIGNDQISTVNYNVFPQQSYEPNQGNKMPKIIGYTVTNTVRVDVRQLNQIGSLIDAALAKGANTINSLEFRSSNEDEARRTALAQAIARARGDAEALAKGAGGHLGDLIEASSNAPIFPRPLARFEAMSVAAASSPTPINPGEQAITVTVTARWRFVADAK
jgi:uncharacterized protein YggE